ncbi:MAG TPA: hypothetical protein VII19_02200 [Acidimicrobiales bacterium]|jgi:hypothetical protein
MVRKSFKWAGRLAVVAALAAVAARLLGSRAASGRAGDGVLPSIGGDTWAPVPTNPNQRG